MLPLSLIKVCQLVEHPHSQRLFDFISEYTNLANAVEEK